MRCTRGSCSIIKRTLEFSQSTGTAIEKADDEFFELSFDQNDTFRSYAGRVLRLSAILKPAILKPANAINEQWIVRWAIRQLRATTEGIRLQHRIRILLAKRSSQHGSPDSSDPALQSSTCQQWIRHGASGRCNNSGQQQQNKDSSALRNHKRVNAWKGCGKLV